MTVVGTPRAITDIDRNQTAGAGEQVLDALGLAPREQRCYEQLVAHPNLTAQELADQLELSLAAVQGYLQRLEAHGLVSGSVDRPVRYLPAPPTVAIEPLILQQREQLERVRAYAEQLMAQYRDTSTTGEVSRYVEMVYGREAFVQRFRQLQQRAATEVAVLNRPPYLTRFSEQEGTERRVLANGVVVRSIYERPDLEQSGGYERATLLLSEGEQARVLASVPMKLAIADRALALVPLNATDPLNHPSALVYPSSLLDALSLLFDMLWAQAAPIGIGAEPAGPAGDALTDRDRAIVQLLQSGLTDQAISRQLGITDRTVTRRVRRLMDLTGTETRFQLGWRAAQAGWLSDSDAVSEASTPE
jgi:sugar-specific transcriptional regulator TrmB